MKIAAPVAVAALALLIAGAALFRFRSDRPEGAEGLPPSPAAPSIGANTFPAYVPDAAGPLATTAVARPPSPEDVASRLYVVLSKMKGNVEANRASGVPLTEGERIRLGALSDEAGRLGAELERLLRETPDLLAALLKTLASFDDPTLAVRIMEAIRGGIADEAEPLFAEMLRSGPEYNARRLAVAALARRESTGSLSALISAADTDQDGRIRLAALTALAGRRNREAASGLAQTINDAIRRRADGDPQEAIREEARRLLPEAADRHPRPPERRGPFSLPHGTK